MSETVLIRLVPPSLPIGFCPVTEQERATLYFQLAQAQLLVNNVSSFYNYGSTVPDINNRNFPWIRNAGDAFDDVYNFLMGYWLAVYKSAPAGPNGIRWGYEGTEASLLTFDGGENAPTTLTTGPFWEIDANYNGRSPMGPGDIPGASPSYSLGVGVVYGAGSQQLTSQQVPPHTHPLATDSAIMNPDGTVKVVRTGVGGEGLFIGGSGPATAPLSVEENEFTTTQENAPIIHPVRGLYQIKRTGRLFRRLGP
jgi:hypothetical protein